MKQLPCEEMLNKDELHAIGAVAVESSSLENLIELLIFFTLDFDPDKDEFEFGEIITDRYQLDGKLSLLRELVYIRIKDAALREKFKAIFDEISDLISRRNTVIHGEWMRQHLLPGGRPPIVTRHKRTQKNIIKIPADKVMDLAYRLAKAHENLWALYERHMRVLSPSPRKAF